MATAIALFVITYALMIALPDYRAYIAALCALIFVVTGIMPIGKVPGYVDWNVILMIGGTMGIVDLFIESRMPSRLADLIIRRTKSIKWTVVALSVFAGIISAFVDNVATVLMVAPVAITIAAKLKVSPVPGVIAIAVASNLEGAATLVGDTTSILLGGYAGMDFLDFFWMQGRPGMFWVVQLGLLAATLTLLFMLRKDKEPAEIEGITEVEDYFPGVLLLGTVALLIGASFVPEKPAITNGLICVVLMAIGIVYETARSGKKGLISRSLLAMDYFTLLLLASLFVVIGGIKEAGVIDRIAELFVRLGGSSAFLMYSIILWASVLLSAFIDNIPYVATMLPVVTGISARMGIDPNLLYFGLLSGATLGGNLTPIGASANIAAIGLLRKNGNEVRNADYMRIGVPYSLAAVTAAYVVIWLLWGA
ncbi:MAG TPA: SLC13 family permease [Bacillota bacterium]|nr:arsenic transporter [Bacillota bacterium]HOA16105.1 SLC13 family permease [Bacillota bacterium]